MDPNRRTWRTNEEKALPRDHKSYFEDEQLAVLINGAVLPPFPFSIRAICFNLYPMYLSNHPGLACAINELIACSGFNYDDIAYLVVGIHKRVHLFACVYFLQFYCGFDFHILNR